MAELIAIVALALVVVAAFAWRPGDAVKIWIRVEAEGITVGGRRTGRHIATADIRQISVAPFWDVFPFDDCWILDGEKPNMVSFLSRDSGAADALHYLERTLANFSVAECKERAHAESAFEEAVVIWRAP